MTFLTSKRATIKFQSSKVVKLKIEGAQGGSPSESIRAR